jgi:flavin-dependent dehydrogenase
MEGGYKAEREVERQINEFNRRNPEIPITRDTIERSMRQHKLTSEITAQLGGITVNRRRMESVLAEQAESLGGGVTLWDLFE